MKGNDIDIKVVLLGKEFGGKTSLVERFVNHRFIERQANRYQATIGAAYASCTIEVDRKSLTMAIWDTAGSERYESMSRMYYRNARAAVVCFDLTEVMSFEKVRFWVSELKTQEENCKIYICGTKSDLIDGNPGLRAEDPLIVTNYVHAIGAKYFETSSKYGHNIEAVFNEIAKDFVNSKMQTVERGAVLNGKDNKKSLKKHSCLKCLIL